MQCIKRIIKKDNRGASLVTVLIAITFVSILGAILLFTTYTGYRVKVANAVGEDRFYDAETAMEQVRAGVQNIVSNSIANAYTKTLTTYDGVSDIDAVFIEEFKQTVLSVADLFILTPPVNNYFSSSGYNGMIEFEEDTLADFITIPGAELSLPGGSASVNITGKWEPSLAQFQIDTITLKGLRVTCDTGDGYHSIVDSDITISMPDLSYARSMFIDIDDYVFIATGVMSAGVGNYEISGSAYVGSVMLDNITSRLTINRGTFISGGVETPGAGNITTVADSLIFEEAASVWANNIILGNSSFPGNVHMLGNTYAAGDLVFRGDYSEATLEGRYFGFGIPEYDNILNTYINDVGSSNSSIVVNSKYNKIDLENLRQLHLAGQTFISLPGSDLSPGGEIFTGQSMTIKTDQLAYLVPTSHLISSDEIYGIDTNPYIVINNFLPDITVDYDAPLWGTTKRLRDYVDPAAPPAAPGLPGGGIQTYYSQPIGSGAATQRLYYIFIKFDDFVNDDGEFITKEQAASSYFRDYFQYNTDEITKYMGIYFDMYKSASSSVFSRGITYDGTFDAAASPADIGVVMNPKSAVSLGYAGYYDNLRRTLTRTAMWDYSNPSTPAPDNPFEYIVEDNPDLPPEGKYYYDGNVLAYVQHAGAPLSLNALEASDPDIDLDELKIIISYADVTVDREFRGLILCKGNIILQNNVFAGGTSISLAIRARHEITGELLSDYLIYAAGEGAEGSSAWNMTELVHYNNWKKQ